MQAAPGARPSRQATLPSASPWDQWWSTSSQHCSHPRGPAARLAHMKMNPLTCCHHVSQWVEGQAVDLVVVCSLNLGHGLSLTQQPEDDGAIVPRCSSTPYNSNFRFNINKWSHDPAMVSLLQEQHACTCKQAPSTTARAHHGTRSAPGSLTPRWWVRHSWWVVLGVKAPVHTAA